MKRSIIKIYCSAALALAAVIAGTYGTLSDRNSNAFALAESASAADIIKIKQHILCDITLDSESIVRYDTNSDGTVSISDLQRYLKLYLSEKNAAITTSVTTTQSETASVTATAVTSFSDTGTTSSPPLSESLTVTSSVQETSAPAETSSAEETYPVIGSGFESSVTTTTEITEPAVTTEVSVTTPVITEPEVTTTTPAPTRPSAYQLSVENILQNPELPTGCEATSLTIILNYHGFNVSKQTIADLMPKGDFYYSGGYLHGPDYITTFPGNPYSGSGYGCYTPCMQTTAQKYFSSVGKDDYYLDNLTGTDFDTVLSYVAAGKPVMVWATMNMIEPRDTISWYTPDERLITWKGNEHCLVITGYNSVTGLVYVNDPLRGKVTYKISVFSHRYDQMGRYSAVIMQKGEHITLLRPAASDPENNGSQTEHHVGDTVTYTGPVYYTSYGGSSIEVSGTYTISEIIDDTSRPYRIRIGSLGWIPYNF